jgi:hypothetical protein
LADSHVRGKIVPEGCYPTAGELAEAERVTRSFVNRLLRLTLLAPDIQEAILEGRQPKAMQLEELTHAIPSGWGEQRGQFFVGFTIPTAARPLSEPHARLQL